VIPAIQLKNDLLARGTSYPEAEWQALEFLIPNNGPEFSDNPPEPLSLEDQMRVIEILERRDEFRGKLRAQKKQPEPD